jgi:opacity protein-like surface antigen
MLQKIFFWISFSTLSFCVVHAEEKMSSDYTLTSGFYAGITGGASSLTQRLSATFGTTEQRARLGKTNIAYGVHGGYFWTISNRFSLGLQATMIKDTLDVESGDVNDDNPITAWKRRFQKKKWAFQAAIQPSIRIYQRTYLYVKAGYELGKYTLSWSDQDGANHASFEKKKDHAPVVGLGMWTPIHEKIFLGCVLEHVFLKKISFVRRNVQNNNDAGNRLKKNYVNRFLVTLSFKFA